MLNIHKGPKFRPLRRNAPSVVLRLGRFTLKDIVVWDRQTDYNAMRPMGYPCKFAIDKVHNCVPFFWKKEE